MDYNHFDQPPIRRAPVGNSMESAAMVLAIISIVGCSCFYLSIPAGAIAAILGLLSRGGKMEFNDRQKLAIALGIAGIVITISFYTISFVRAYLEYGSIRGIIDATAQYTGVTYEQLMEMLGY